MTCFSFPLFPQGSFNIKKCAEMLPSISRHPQKYKYVSFIFPQMSFHDYLNHSKFSLISKGPGHVFGSDGQKSLHVHNIFELWMTNLMITDVWQSLFSLSQTANMPEDYPDQFDEVVDFIQATIKRLRRSPDKQTPVFSRRERNRQNAATNIENSNKKGRRNQKGKNRGCVLTEIHLNVTALDLGYETKEELIFRYCSGSCDAAETTYDKILKNLTKKKKLVTDKVRQACCRPTAFDDDLSFLDDNLVYHILKKHSAKRCGCVWQLHAEAAPVSHSCYAAKRGTKVPRAVSAPSGGKRTKNTEWGAMRTWG